MGDRPRFYEGAIPEAESKRLTEFEFPDFVSAQVVPVFLKGKTFLDIGAGPGPALEGIVKKRGGKYVAADRNIGFLKARKTGLRVGAEITELPFKDKTAEGSIDFSHTRFVMMHLPQDARTKAFGEINRVSKKALVLDYDWGSWETRVAEKEKSAGANVSPAVMLQRRFIENAKELSALANIELNMGAKLKSEAEAAIGAPVKEERHARKSGNYYSELIGLGTAEAGMWRKFGKEDKAKEIEQIVEEIKKLQGQDAEAFSPPDVVVVRF